MNVTLIDYTGAGHWAPARYAAAILLFTKSTRLQMHPAGLAQMLDWPQEKITRELAYMADTIPSSWEFVDYTFMIEKVTRAFTHQLVRTRTASFAQQTMRVLDVSGWTYGTGPSIKGHPADADLLYAETMQTIDEAYRRLIDAGVSIEDARGILPTNIHTNIVMKINMRNLVELIRKRSSPRTQGEYREVLDAMKAAVLEVHPFMDIFFNTGRAKAAADLDAEVSKVLDPEMRVRMLKLVDQLR